MLSKHAPSKMSRFFHGEFFTVNSLSMHVRHINVCNTNVGNIKIKHSIILAQKCHIILKAGESQSRSPGQVSDYTLRGPNYLDSSTHEQTYQDFGPPKPSGPQVFCPPPFLAGFDYPPQTIFLQRIFKAI